MIAIMGGFGIGNDPNAHTSGIGLGATRVETSDMLFTQTGANSITIGGIQADAHHPSDERMINQDNLITQNVFNDTAITVTSAAAILVTYNTGTEISHNTLTNLPYSGIAWGYGWGSNDAGGNPVYVLRGLYDYQPIYTTPTTQKNGVIKNNLLQEYGLKHTDLGGIYTLSASPNTTIQGNCIFSHNGAAYYHDEGSRFYVDSDSVLNAAGNSAKDGWWQANHSPGQTTGNLTAHTMAVAQSLELENGRNEYGDNVYNVTHYASLKDLSSFYQKILSECGAARSPYAGGR